MHDVTSGDRSDHGLGRDDLSGLLGELADHRLDLVLAGVDAAAGRLPPGAADTGVGVLEQEQTVGRVEQQHAHRRPGAAAPVGGGVGDDEVAHQSACETLDMLKSGTRSAGIAVREK